MWTILLQDKILIYLLQVWINIKGYNNSSEKPSDSWVKDAPKAVEGFLASTQ